MACEFQLDPVHLLGSSAYDLALYHLYCHAFFKALLFMSAGSIIHSYMSETQDMRKYGGLINYLPFNYNFPKITLKYTNFQLFCKNSVFVPFQTINEIFRSFSFIGLKGLS